MCAHLNTAVCCPASTSLTASRDSVRGLPTAVTHCSTRSPASSSTKHACGLPRLQYLRNRAPRCNAATSGVQGEACQRIAQSELRAESRQRRRRRVQCCAHRVRSVGRCSFVRALHSLCRLLERLTSRLWPKFNNAPSLHRVSTLQPTTQAPHARVPDVHHATGGGTLYATSSMARFIFCSWGLPCRRFFPFLCSSSPCPQSAPRP